MTMLAEALPPHDGVRRWTKSEFYALVAGGGLEGKRVYLHRGELIEMASMGALHAIGAINVDDWCHDTFRPQYRVRSQCPFELPDASVRLPDETVVTHEENARRPHPSSAVLVVEVSDSSVELDREVADDYATARVPDYWIVNMRDREIEVYRDPVPDAASPTGWRYASHRVYHEGESVASLARPDAAVAVATLLRT